MVGTDRYMHKGGGGKRVASLVLSRRERKKGSKSKRERERWRERVCARVRESERAGGRE